MRRTMTGRGSSRRAPALMAGLTASLVASLVAAIPAGAAQAAPIPAAKHAAGWARVIVSLKGPLTGPDRAKLDALRADTYRHLPLINAVALRLPQHNVHRLASLPFVRHLSPDAGVTKCDEFTTVSSGAASAWQQYNVSGAGVTVAVLDSGIKEHEDLSSPKQKGNNEDDSFNGSSVLVHLDMTGAPPPTTLDADSQPLYDLCGHGTHVAGIIAGNGRASLGKRFFHTFYGIAPQASLIDVRVLDSDGRSDISTVIAGLQWVVANQSQYHIRVVNLSLGHPVGESYKTDPLCQAVEAAWKAGIVVVCAAGNSGRTNTANQADQGNEGWGTNYGSINSPANDPCVLTVGATKQDLSHLGEKSYDRIATYSGRGPSRLDMVLKPDVVAPGNRVISLEASKDYLSTHYNVTNQISLSSYLHTESVAPSDTYFSLSGTSMASPVVAGAAALLLQADPTLTPDTVKARLMLSADKWAAPDGSADPLTYGAGYLDIPAALASTATATLPALSPTLTANSDGTLSLVMDRAAWGSSLWGTGITDLRAAWGSSVTSDRAAWGSGGTAADRAAWGSVSVGSSRAAWGSSVWSDRAAWGSSTSAVDLSSTAINGDIVTAPRGTTHLLWNNSDGKAMLWSIAPDGTHTSNTFGPYSDGAPNTPWHASALATGPDGKSHILWTNPDGRVILWTVDDAGSFSYQIYGPYTDGSPNTPWSAKALSVGADNLVHILWTNPDGRVILWNVDTSFNFTYALFGPYDDGAPNTPWSAAALATGPDSISRLVWTNPDGRVILWNVDNAFHFTYALYGPYTDGSPSTPWGASAVSVGLDNVTHLLWTNPNGRVILWNVDRAFQFTLAAFGPYTDGSPSTPWGASALATGSDGLSHLLWTNPDNRVILWGVDSAFNFTYAVNGPLTDGAAQNIWSATAISAGP